jgi:hypothetical protein
MKDYPALKQWLNQLTEQDRIHYVAQSLASGTDGVFWDLVHEHDLKARSPQELAMKVLEKLYV